PDAFWGPAVYYDHRSDQYVMLMSKLKDRDRWGSEGYYVSFNSNLDNPEGWSEPKRLDVPGDQGWYPQVISGSPGLPYTEIDGSGMLFIHGKAIYRIEFDASQCASN